MVLISELDLSLFFPIFYYVLKCIFVSGSNACLTMRCQIKQNIGFFLIFKRSNLRLAVLTVEVLIQKKFLSLQHLHKGIYSTVYQEETTTKRAISSLNLKTDSSINNETHTHIYSPFSVTVRFVMFLFV